MTKSPIVRPVSWLNAGITLAILAVFAFIGYTINRTYGIFVGAMIYLALSQLLRRVIARHHRNAIRLCKLGEYEQAIPDFQKSVVFFRAHEWIDRFRAVTMLSAAGMWYREMALVSLGFCYAQIGDGLNARQYYEQCLQEFPNNTMARCALRLMDAGAGRNDAGKATVQSESL